MSTLHVAPTHIFKHTAPRALRSMAVALALLSVSFPVGAQSNVRAWSADGQVFVVWQNAATAPLTYDIYRSEAPITSTSQGTLSLDWLAWLATRPGALGQPLASGRVFQAQCWFRDPAAPGGTHLSQGLEWTLAP